MIEECVLGWHDSRVHIRYFTFDLSIILQDLVTLDKMPTYTLLGGASSLIDNIVVQQSLRHGKLSKLLFTDK